MPNNTDIHPVFQVNNFVEKYIFRPHKDNPKWDNVWAMYKEQESCFWKVSDINLSDDVHVWKTLKSDEQQFLSHVLAFFAASDGIVAENNQRFLEDIEVPSIKAFYMIQAAFESIHAQMYTKLLDTYVTDEQENERLFHAIQTIPSIQKKADWAIKWRNSDAPFIVRLLAFIVVEGVFFSGSFCAIFWLARKRSLGEIGLVKSNEYINRDEGLHCQFGCVLYDMIPKQDRYPETQVHEIFKSAVEIEREFICDALKVDLIGMNKDLMYQYICYVADFWLQRLGYSKIYNVENPFDFMNLLSLVSKSNFFETRPTEYGLANMTGEFKIVDNF